MNHNPYVPPLAAVGDVEAAAPRQRPVAVWIAVALVGINILMGMASHLRVWRMYVTASESAYIGLAVQMLKWLVSLLICLHLWRGRNWARILLLVYTALLMFSAIIAFLAIANLPQGVKYLADPMAVATMLLPLVIHAVASILVFVAGRAWFALRPSGS